MERDKVLDRVSDELMFRTGFMNKEEITVFLSMVYGAGFAKAWHIAHSRNKRKVMQMTLDGRAIKIWENIGEVQSRTGIDKSNISKCCRGLRRSTGGFKWQYTEL